MIEDLSEEVNLLREELKCPPDAVQWKMRADGYDKQAKHLDFKLRQLEKASGSNQLRLKGDIQTLGDGDVVYSLPMSREVVWYELDKLQRLAFKLNNELKQAIKDKEDMHTKMKEAKNSRKSLSPNSKKKFENAELNLWKLEREMDEKLTAKDAEIAKLEKALKARSDQMEKMAAKERDCQAALAREIRRGGETEAALLSEKSKREADSLESTQKIEDLISQIESKASDLHGSKNAASTMELELKSQIAKTCRDNATLSHKLRKLGEKEKEAEHQLQKADARIRSLQETVEQRERSLKDVSDTLAAATADLEHEKAQHERERDTWDTKLLAENDKMEALLKVKTNFEVQLSDARQALRDSAQRESCVENERLRLDAELVTLQRKVEALEFSYTNLQEDHETLTQVFEYGRDENAKMQESFQKELDDASLLLEEQKQLYSTEVERYSRLLEEMQQMQASASQDGAEQRRAMMDAHHKAIEDLAGAFFGVPRSSSVYLDGWMVGSYLFQSQVCVSCALLSSAAHLFVSPDYLPDIPFFLVAESKAMMEGKREVQGQLEASLMLNRDLQKQLEASQYETQQRAHDFEVRVRLLLLLA
jgi:hypothetical protein